MKKYNIAILGAGVMGSQIALEFARFGYIVYLYDQYTSKENNENFLAETGINKTIENISAKEMINNISLKDIYQQAKQNIIYCNFKTNLNKLKDCDFVLEAIIEEITAKENLFKLICPYLNNYTVLASNTSGLNIDTLSNYAHDKNLFCGFHFFNPPRHLHLIEYVPINSENQYLLDILADFKHNQLPFKIIQVKNTPNFIVNKIGFFAWLVSVHSAKEFNIPLEIVDELTGKLIGRAKSATYRTADIVGLDVVQHVLHTMQNIKDDKFKPWYEIPESLLHLIKHNNLGQKTQAGFYKKYNDKIMLWDEKISSDINYRDIKYTADKEVIQAVKDISDIKQKLHNLSLLKTKQAQFLFQVINLVNEYINYHKNTIAYSDNDIEKAMNYGFGWEHAQSI